MESKRGKPSGPGCGRPRGLEGRLGAADGCGARLVALGCEVEGTWCRPSQRTTEVALQFGLPPGAGERATVVEPTRVAIGPGRILLLAGPSGSGKSTALGRIESHFASGCMVGRVGFRPDQAILDQVAPWAPLGEALSILTACGLGDAHLWVRPFEALSDGEKFRAKLARAVARHTRAPSAAPLLCDEFCSTLHRRVAKAISYCLHKLVTRRGLSVVLACSNEDVIADLQPHTIVWMKGGKCEVEERTVEDGRPISFRRRLRIERGNKKDYDAFAAMHYRATDELGFVDKVFVMRDGPQGDPLGIVVYSHGPLELSLRNRATDGWFSGHAGRVNRSLRILRRLVIHPDVRGCGLGHYLVRRTLPLVGTEFVECLATMAEFNPVFEKAGMERVGQYGIEPKRQEALESLRAMGVDPNAREFTLKVCRRREVREVVSRAVYDWYASTTVGGERRVERQSPELLARTFRGLMGSRPVYYLWRGKKAKNVA